MPKPSSDVAIDSDLNTVTIDGVAWDCGALIRNAADGDAGAMMALRRAVAKGFKRGPQGHGGGTGEI